MLAQSQNLYNCQVVHLPLLPIWKDYGLELSPGEVNRVKESYLSNPEVTFTDCSHKLRPSEIDGGSFKLSCELRILNRACVVSICYHGETGLWDSSLVTPITSLRDTTDPKGYLPALGKLFRHYFRLSDQVFSNVARI